MRDDTPRRGFSRERHATLKLAISALALAGFAAAWLGFSSAHDPGPSAVPPPAAVPATATAAVAASITSTPGEPDATPTARPRTSRGS